MTNESPFPAFAIAWHIDDSEWEKAAKFAAANPPGSFFERQRLVFYDLFTGRLQLCYDGDLMFKPRRLALRIKKEDPERDRQGRKWYERVLKANHFGLGGLSIGDFARQMAGIMTELSFEGAPSGTLVAWHNCDDPNAITFEKERDLVCIRHAYGWTPKLQPERKWAGADYFYDDSCLLVPHEEFFAGVKDFLREFTQEIEARVPEMLEWSSFERFEGWRSSTGGLAQRNNWQSETQDRTVRAIIKAKSIAAIGTPALRFELDYSDIDWKTAREMRDADPRGAYYDTSLMAVSNLLRADIRITLDGSPVETAEPIAYYDQVRKAYALKKGRPKPQKTPYEANLPSWSPIGLALQLTRILNPDRFHGPFSRHEYWLWPDPRGFIGWDNLGYRVFNRPSLLDEIEAVVGTERFLEGARYFLAEFVASIGENVPELLDWQTFDPIVECIESTEIGAYEQA